ncbi:MAG TPA: hypothetical protein VL201_02175 [Patescibacteria group bacterium]|jgi:hypothetical protein|nr:hypothetical protein [Patescibacteria group bacterium]
MTFRNILFIISFLLFKTFLYGTEERPLLEENSNTVIYAIPGQNGKGSSPKYIMEVLNCAKKDIVQIKTPYWFPDLGQHYCQKYLIEALENES